MTSVCNKVIVTEVVLSFSVERAFTVYLVLTVTKFAKAYSVY